MWGNEKFNQKALFSDESGNYRKPTEPDRGERVEIKFRTARNDVDLVYLICGNQKTAMEKTYSKDIIYAIYPDVVKEIEKDKLDYKFIKKHGTCSTLYFYAKVAWFYRKKITVSKLVFYLRKKAKLAVKRGFN